MTEVGTLAGFEVYVQVDENGTMVMARARHKSLRTIQIVACPDRPRIVGEFSTLPKWEKA